ncbi:MAG: hypothetical protein COA42_16960 [Alteromonadaceae bacterium]|nr:MAG: hypothetical protein COA42_16960 [Alteromonadaceae bacterium]
MLNWSEQVKGLSSIGPANSPVSSEGKSLDDLIECYSRNREELGERLLKDGAILLRGFDIKNANDFESVIQKITEDWKPYIEGQSQRQRVQGQVYTSTEYPASQHITLHNELSYASEPPRTIAFFCETPPATGGQTPILDCRDFRQHLEGGVLEPFTEKGVRYVKNMHGGKGFGKSWQDHFESQDREEVEGYLKKGDVDFEWLPNNTLRTSQFRPASVQHPQTNEWVWFNQVDLWHYTNLGKQGDALVKMLGEANLPTHAFYGDGSPISAETINTIRQARLEQAIIFDWQAGDILLADNWLMAHGRTPFTGARRVLVAMS